MDYYVEGEFLFFFFCRHFIVSSLFSMGFYEGGYFPPFFLSISFTHHMIPPYLPSIYPFVRLLDCIHPSFGYHAFCTMTSGYHGFLFVSIPLNCWHVL
ncbi:hypothetical protein BDB01DRAFT_809114 [Pilobolus umbonatus]|nr:hypothetical protein BDB01DRAFT_809114 [Pilobolus umbonatus]